MDLILMDGSLDFGFGYVLSTYAGNMILHMLRGGRRFVGCWLLVADPFPFLGVLEPEVTVPVSSSSISSPSISSAWGGGHLMKSRISPMNAARMKVAFVLLLLVVLFFFF